jgi:PAS domain S-box-containing protein
MTAARSSGVTLETAAAPALPEPDDPFRLLVDQVVDYAIYHLDLAGRVSSWNVGAERIKGYVAEEVLGASFSLFFTEEDRIQGKPARILEAARAHGRHEEEGWRIRKDGSRFPASAVVTALHDCDGRLTGFAKITRDLTARVRAEEAARKLGEERAARAQAERAEQERQALLRRQSELNALRADVSGLAATEGDPLRMLDRAARAVVARLGAAAARIWTFDEQGALVQQASAGVAPSHLPSADELRASVVGRIAATGAPAVSHDPAADPVLALAGEPLQALSFVGAPLMAGGSTLGVLGAFGHGRLPEDTLDALRGVADVLAHSLVRRRAEAEVRRSRDQLAIILATISDGVTAQGRDGRLIFANDAAARVCGFETAAEMTACPPQEIVARFEVRDEQGAPFPLGDLPGRKALRGELAKVILRARNRNTGEERWSQVAAAPVRGESGEVELAVNVFHDLTERKRTEDAWRFLAEASAVLGSSLDYETTLASVAHMAVPQIADWCAVDLLAEGGQLEMLAVAHADPAKVALVRELRRQRPCRPGDPGAMEVLATGKAQLLSPVTEDLLDRAGDDEAQRALLRSLGMRSTIVVPIIVSGRPFGALTFTTAESGRRYTEQDLILAQEIAQRASLAVGNARAYREARDAVRMRDTFLSIASHELKTPLSSLTLLLSGLLRTARDGRLEAMGTDKLIARLTRIEEQADRLTELMNQLLDVSRLAAGRFALAPADTDLAAVARDVLARFREEAGQLGASVTLIEEGPVVGHWDRSRLDQVVTNLLTNALKYGGNSAVTVEVVGDAATARLTVTDRGPGIPAADQARIFEQYERAASDNLGGLGLGLWIVRQLVQAHGGEISLRSDPGQGASFTVVLPRRRSA